jgi:hypothetical protein
MNLAASKLVLIFLSDPPEQKSTPTGYAQGWSDFQAALLDAAFGYRFPRDVTLVNIESAAVGNRNLDDAEEASQSRVATETIEKIFKDIIKELEEHFGPQLVDIRSTKFTFVSMIRPWLEIRD